MKTDYKNESYINSLVDEYKKSGDIVTRDKLIECFDPYFDKYSNLVCGHNSANLFNKDTMTFLRLFMTSSERSNDDTARHAGKKYIKMIRKIFSDFTKLDIYDEMLLYFLEQLKKYRMMIADHKISRERISFTHFIQVNLRYKLKNLTISKARDALSVDNCIEYNDLLGNAIYAASSGDKHKEINIDWVDGQTTDDVFKHLKRWERYLLWIKYESRIDGGVVTNYDMADMLGLHRKAVDYRFEKIKKKIEGLIK